MHIAPLPSSALPAHVPPAAPPLRSTSVASRASAEPYVTPGTYFVPREVDPIRDQPWAKFFRTTITVAADQQRTTGTTKVMGWATDPGYPDYPGPFPLRD